MFTKNQYRGGRLDKKRGLGLFADLRGRGGGGLARKRVVVFLRRGRGETPMHTMGLFD